MYFYKIKFIINFIVAPAKDKIPSCFSFHFTHLLTSRLARRKSRSPWNRCCAWLYAWRDTPGDTPVELRTKTHYLPPSHHVPQKRD